MAEKFVYVVTAGEYSDYRICAVFDSEEKAVDYCLRQNRGLSERRRVFSQEYRVEPFGINDEKPSIPEVSVAVDKNGYIVEMDEGGSWESGCFLRGKMWGRSSRGKDVATKIARDYLAMYKAQEEVE